jgi:hypothetical protein
MFAMVFNKNKGLNIYNFNSETKQFFDFSNFILKRKSFHLFFALHPSPILAY